MEKGEKKVFNHGLLDSVSPVTEIGQPSSFLRAPFICNRPTLITLTNYKDIPFWPDTSCFKNCSGAIFVCIHVCECVCAWISVCLCVHVKKILAIENFIKLSIIGRCTRKRKGFQPCHAMGKESQGTRKNKELAMAYGGVW